MMIAKRALLIGACVVLLGACEKKVRTHASSSASLSGSENVVETSWAPSSAYRFVSADQTVADARRAAEQEHWAEAAGAAEAMLRTQPTNAEARSIDDKAKLEGPSQLRFNEFQKAAAANDMQAMVKYYRQISDASMYKERARATFEKARDAWIDSQQGDARAFARTGKCDEARRVARVTIETFAETRNAMESISGACRGQRESKAVAVNDKVERERERVREERTPEPAAAATPPAPAAQNTDRVDSRPAPTMVAAIGEKRPLTGMPGTRTPDLTRPVAETAAPAAAPAPPPAGASATPPPAAPRTNVQPKNVAAPELEGYRISGEKQPTLSAGAKMVAHRDGVKMIQMAVSLCLSDRGEPSSVNLKLSSEYADANEKLLKDIRAWRFRPYQVNGQATPVCTAYVFRYTVQ